MPRRFEDMTEPELSAIMKAMASAVEKVAEIGCAEKPYFALLVFNDPKIAQYVSNCDRATMVSALREVAGRIERKEILERTSFEVFAEFD